MSQQSGPAEVKLHSNLPVIWPMYGWGPRNPPAALSLAAFCQGEQQLCQKAGIVAGDVVFNQ